MHKCAVLQILQIFKLKVMNFFKNVLNWTNAFTSLRHDLRTDKIVFGQTKHL